MDNIFKFFNIDMTSSISLLNYNYDEIVNKIRRSNLDKKNKSFIIFFINEKYNYAYDKLNKKNKNNDDMIWEYIDNL